MSRNKKKFITDSRGYLKNFLDWNRTFTLLTANKERIVLSSEKWELIFHVRKFYIKFNIVPNIRMLIMEINKIAEKKVSSTTLYFLFPGGLNQLIKISGLPKPSHCL